MQISDENQDASDQNAMETSPSADQIASCRKRYTEGGATDCRNESNHQETNRKKSKCPKLNENERDAFDIRFNSIDYSSEDNENNGVVTACCLRSVDNLENFPTSFDTDEEESDDEDFENEEDCEYDCEELLKGINILQECIKSYQHERELLNAERQNRLNRQKVVFPTSIRRKIRLDHCYHATHDRPGNPTSFVPKITPNNSSDDLISFLVAELEAIEKHSMKQLLVTAGFQS